MNEEYTYDIGKYTIGVDTNGEDGIGLTVAIINDDGEIHFLGNCYGDNAKCIDLLIKENQQLKEQLKQKEDIINKAKEYIINNSLYEEEYDYDYEENIYLSGIHDDDVRRILLEILDNKGE